MRTKKKFYVRLAVVFMLLFNVTTADVKDFFGKWQKLDFAGMYTDIDSISKTKLTEKLFVKKFADFYGAVGAKKLTVAYEIIESSKEISFHVELETFDGEMKYDGKLKTVLEGETEKVKWIDSIIYPELEEGDIIQVEREEAIRGEILDRNNKILAKNEILYSIFLRNDAVKTINVKQKKSISELLGVKISDLNSEIQNSKGKKDNLLLKKFYGEVKNLEKIKSNNILIIESKKIRYYPEHENAAHDIGYVQPIVLKDLSKMEKNNITVGDIVGKSGFEKIYDDRLRAIDALKVIILSKSGDIKKILISRQKKNGQNIKISTDISLQKKLYSVIGEDVGFGVVVKAKTGEVIAMASTPTYDNNKFITGFSPELWKKLNENIDKPFYNKIIGRFSPGSTFKPIIAEIAIENKNLNPEKDLKIKKLYWQKGKSWGKYFVKRVHYYEGPSNLYNAMTYSDNIYFARTALDTGSEVLIDGFKKMGISEEIPSDMRLVKSQYSNKEEISTEIQLADTGYGQGQVLINPIHEALIYSSFVNGGNILKPKFEYSEKPVGEIWKSGIATEGSIAIVVRALRSVVKNPEGTGHGAEIEGMKIAGKTGTAEIKAAKNDLNGKELGWFCAFDTEKPDCVVVMMIENVKDRGGSHYVVPKVRKIIEEIAGIKKK